MAAFIKTNPTFIYHKLRQFEPFIQNVHWRYKCPLLRALSGRHSYALSPGSTFQPTRTAVATGLSFINTLCARSEHNLTILMENNKNHQITLPKGRIGFSSLDVVDREEPKYQKRSPYELTNAIISTDERHNDCFSYFQRLQLRALTNFCRLSMVPKIRSSSNLIQLDIAFLLMVERVKVLPTSCLTESLPLDQHAAKQDF